MKNYNPETMITVKEAKNYAMNRRFEVSPDERIHVCVGGVVYREHMKTFENIPFPMIDSENLLEGFEAWDKEGINMIGEKGCVRSCFFKKDFFALFVNYPQE